MILKCLILCTLVSTFIHANGQLLRPDVMDLGLYNPETKKYEKTEKHPVIGGGDHDYKPHNSPVIGGGDHDYKPHNSPVIGGGDHDYKPHNSPVIGGGDHDYKPHNSPVIGGGDHDFKPHNSPVIGGGDHDYKPHKKKAILGGGDHDYKNHKKVLFGQGDHDFKSHKQPVIGGGDYDYKPHNKKAIFGADGHDYNIHKKHMIGGDDHDFKSHKKAKKMIGGDDHDFKSHKKHRIGGDDHDYKPHKKHMIGGDDHDLKSHKMALLGADGHDHKVHKKHLIGGGDHDFKPHKKILLGADGHDKRAHKKAKFGGDDHDYKPHKKATLGDDDHDFKPHNNKAFIAGAYKMPFFGLFNKFATTHNRTFKGHKDFFKRLRVFQNNMKKIAALTQNEKGTAKYGVTKFADWTTSEFRTLLGLRTHLKPSKSMTPAQIPDITIPDEFDWRDKNVVTPVKNQGMCGSCWAFSVTGNVEGQWALKHQQLYSLSEQELVDCDDTDQGCNGGMPESAYKAIQDLGGLETENGYPYEGKDDKCQLDKSKIKVMVNGSVELPEDEVAIAKWLVKNGPISIGINANALQFYMGGVSHPYKFLCNPDSLDHGMLIVGYGVHTSKYLHHKQPYWLIKNSWGPDWGEKGYYRVYRGDGTCGVNKMATSATVP